MYSIFFTGMGHTHCVPFDTLEEAIKIGISKNLEFCVFRLNEDDSRSVAAIWTPEIGTTFYNQEGLPC